MIFEIEKNTNGFAPSAAGKASGTGMAGSRLGAFLKRVLSIASVRRSERRLRLREMLPLGEKRFVAVVEYGPDKFILAGTPHSISLLKKFPTNCEGAENARNSAASAK